MNKIVGRNHEISLLKQALNSDKSELLAIYGRRRVGKTFLIREFFKSEIIFEVSGLYNGTMKDQLNNFSREISKKAKKTENKNASDWFDAFALLENYILFLIFLLLFYFRLIYIHTYLQKHTLLLNHHYQTKDFPN